MSDLPPSFEIICPECGGRVVVDTVTPALAHGQPACRRFLELEPDDFIAWCNQIAAAKQRPVAGDA